jgi:hypothetical protein
MPYDSSLDERLFAKEWENDMTKLVVGVYSYNGGAKKLQISRELKGDRAADRPGFAKLGRMTKDELQGILPLLQEALGQM